MRGGLFREGDGAVVCFTHTPYTCTDKPEKWGEVFGVVKEVSEVEG